MIQKEEALKLLSEDINYTEFAFEAICKVIADILKPNVKTALRIGAQAIREGRNSEIEGDIFILGIQLGGDIQKNYIVELFKGEGEMCRWPYVVRESNLMIDTDGYDIAIYSFGDNDIICGTAHNVKTIEDSLTITERINKILLYIEYTLSVLEYMTEKDVPEFIDELFKLAKESGHNAS